jgi:tetratricopeptide (TPR) repeat protein
MKRCFPLLLLVTFGCAVPAPACFNDYVPNTEAIERSRLVVKQIIAHVPKEPWPERRDRLRRELAADGDYRVKNDLATALAHTGEAAESVTLLEQIETEKPGLYATASNLGTAYELTGNNQKALEWIRKGIERNADSHGGTEWLHVRILEAKLAIKNDARWIENNSVLGSQSEKVALLGNRGESLTSDQVKEALIYQLHERLQFVRPPDAIVTDLAIQLAQLLAEEPTGNGGAVGVAALAEKYGEGLPEMQSLLVEAGYIRALVSRGRSRRPGDPHWWNSPAVELWLIPAGGLFGLLVVALRRQMQRAPAKARETTTDVVRAG